MGTVIPALVTPFTDRGDVDYQQAVRLAEHLIAEGCDALVVAGTTGESPTLSTHEKLTLFERMVDHLGDRCFIWAGTGNNSTADSVSLTKEAEKIGVDGVMLVTPYYNKPSQEGLYQHFAHVASSTNLPVMLYNVPSRTGVNLQPATAARLSRIENIVALKEASGNLDQMSELVLQCDPNFVIYSGEDSLVLPMLSLGAKGVVSVAAHLVAADLRKMVDAFAEGRTDEARKIHQKIFPLCKALFVTTNPVPVKQALEWQGWRMGGYREPLVNMSDEEARVLRHAMDTCITK